MNKAVIVGIIIIIIIIIIGIAYSIPMENDINNSQDLPSEINLEENNDLEEISTVEEEPSGRNLTVELNETLGLSTP